MENKEFEDFVNYLKTQPQVYPLNANRQPMKAKERARYDIKAKKFQLRWIQSGVSQEAVLFRQVLQAGRKLGTWKRVLRAEELEPILFQAHEEGNHIGRDKLQ